VIKPVAPSATQAAKLDHKKGELAKFNLDFEKLRICFEEAEQKAKECLLKTAALRQADFCRKQFQADKEIVSLAIRQNEFVFESA
jgi:hypothetical protein